MHQLAIFISCVSPEFRQTRSRVALILTRLGYTPVFQEIFGTEPGDLRQVLRDKIDACEGLIQIVGYGYGAEPPTVDANYGRVSYTQFELLYAQAQSKKTWLPFAGDACTRDTPLERLDLPNDPAHPDPSGYQAERRALQLAYCDARKKDGQLYYEATSDADLELKIERFRDDLTELRQFVTTFGKFGKKLLAGLAAILARSTMTTEKARAYVLESAERTHHVFISCKNLDDDGVQTRDAQIAAEAYDFLMSKGLSVFLSTFPLEQLGASDYTSAIDSALDSASVLLAIGTSADHLNSRSVKYEWDSFANDIRRGIKPNGRIFTYIEGMPITALPRALRQTQTFVHSKGSLQRLYNFIAQALSPSDSPKLVIGHGIPAHVSRPGAPSQVEKPTMLQGQVFISYSHKDKRWRDELDTHLRPYLRGGSIVSWSDQQIAPNSKWFEEIQSALAKSKVAVLLVSPDFLTSDFIYEHELGPLLKAAEQGGVRILWVPVRASAYKKTALKDYQAVLGRPWPT